MINPWWADPRVGEAERLLNYAECAAKRKDVELAKKKFAEAGGLYAEVALTVPASRPDTRRDLFEAAIACLRRAGVVDRVRDLEARLAKLPIALGVEA